MSGSQFVIFLFSILNASLFLLFKYGPVIKLGDGKLLFIDQIPNPGVGYGFLIVK